jgi:CxxC motif-containing protein (DUF1111 family)
MLGAMSLFTACGGGEAQHAPAVHSPTASASPTATASPTPLFDRRLTGGDTTVFDDSANAFTFPARNLPLEQRTSFFVGNALFNRNWVTAPSSTEGSDGLGPIFNARSCSACHFKDGRGRPPLDADEPMLSMLVRLSIPGLSEDEGPVPEPNYGLQLGPQAILGVPPEGRALVSYSERPGRFADGEDYSLRVPAITFTDLAFGPLASDVQTSPRVAPFLIGLGLLQAVDHETILASADPDDRDGDGISGRPNWVWDVRRQATVLGRFGWKANQPTLEQQNAAAFIGDIGITSPLFPEQDCPVVQAACSAAPSGGLPEIDQGKLDSVTFYTHELAVPARRDVEDPEVQQGEMLFAALGCAACHRPVLITGDLASFPELSRQVIQPYTDLLLHDMGEHLADGRPDHAASGREWRTAPLWGIGLVSTVNRHSFFLHDGRARDLTEAVLWHGGEAEGVRQRFEQLSPADRAALLRFLGSL